VISAYLSTIKGEEISMVVSTGYGTCRGFLAEVHDHYVVLHRGDKSDLMIALAHIVTVWRES
jgi:Protein of unknown function (DUF2642)